MNETTKTYENDISEDTFLSVRHTIQFILIPIVVIIGIAGNVLTVAVLTRRRMRCSTNIYLTALAFSDIGYLIFVFIMSLQHYKGMHDKNMYWSFYGLSHWFHDALLYTSVYLTVSFTLERYISVCHPLRGQVLCTESRAKRVIFVVVILCFMLLVTTPFEFKLNKTFVPTCKEKNFTQICTNETKITLGESELGKSELYKEIFYYFTVIVFKLIPLILLAVLNYFLIATVRKSHTMRNTMTNIRQSQSDSSQENKVTITLIAVVILFLVCQTPSAVQLIVTMDYDEDDHQPPRYVLAMNNVFNLLVNINAASNFILYCALSDKYRKTVKDIFCGTKPLRKNTLSSSRFTSGRTTTSSFYSRTGNGSFFNRHRFRAKEPKRFSISKEEYENLKAVTENMKLPRYSIASSAASDHSRTNSIAETVITEGVPMTTLPTASQREKQRRGIGLKNIRNKKQNQIDKTSPSKSINATIPELEVEPPPATQPQPVQPTQTKSNPITATQHNNACFLRASPSETSLTRSRSLILPPKTKHSPDCKENSTKLID